MGKITISTSLSAKIPTGSYENYSPFFSITEEVEAELSNGQVSERIDSYRNLLRGKLDEEYARQHVKRIQKQRRDIRFYARGDKQYPSITSVINGVEPIEYDPGKLAQYGSRGNLIHKQVENWVKTGQWETDFSKMQGTRIDLMIVQQGDLGLSLNGYNWLGFVEKHGKDFDFKETELTVYLDEWECAGTIDLLCSYQGQEAVADIKTATQYTEEKLTRYWKQLAAYAKGSGAKCMVIIPLKGGNTVSKPIVEADVDGHFQKFLRDREAFRQIYGI